MLLAAHVLVGLVALLHAYFLVLEMFLWTTPFGQKTFKRTKAQQEETAVLAKNQGLYNGFLAAGLIWGAVHTDPAMGFQIKLFFLSCVIIAGIYGAATVSGRILLVQSLPAAIAMALVFLAR